MTTLAQSSAPIKPGFDAIASAFLQEAGLPFASVLDAEAIQRAFREEDALFGQGDLFSTEVVLWAFLAQTLRDGKEVACAAAVADIATYLLQTGRRPPCGDTGDYCRARAKLNLSALRRLVRGSADQLEQAAEASWLWKGRHTKLVDGFTFTMPDTEANQRAFPQPGSQAPGVGFPIARACAILSLATACLCDVAIGPYKGKETGETALLREMLDRFDDNDVAVFDRYYCSYMMLAMLSQRGVHVCTRQHQLRPTDFRRGHRLGPDDHLITWLRPQRPTWMSLEQYERIPETLTLRELQFEVTDPGCRTETLIIVTTLTDPEVYSKENIAELYGFRWNVELDLLQIKQTLHLDPVRCKSPDMVRRELWVTLLAYNLIRKVIAASAVMYDQQPRHLGFTRACQTILAAWMLLSTDACRDVAALHQTIFAHIAANTVADRHRSHRTPSPETTPKTLPPHDSPTPTTQSRTDENINLDQQYLCRRQCHSERRPVSVCVTDLRFLYPLRALGHRRRHWEGGRTLAGGFSVIVTYSTGMPTMTTLSMGHHQSLSASIMANVTTVIWAPAGWFSST